MTSPVDPIASPLRCLRRAVEIGYPWSVSPHEARALVAEVERLRALEADAERALVKAELWSYYEAFVAANGAGSITELVTQRDEARAEAATMRAWAEKAAAAENANAEDARKERAAVVACLRLADDVSPYDEIAAVIAFIERGAHLREETQMTTERSCYTCRWARGDVCDHPPCSEEMDVGIEDYVHAAGCGSTNDGMPLDRTIDCPGHERGEHRNEETK